MLKCKEPQRRNKIFIHRQRLQMHKDVLPGQSIFTGGSFNTRCDNQGLS